MNKVLTKLKTVLETSAAGRFKQIYVGDPLVIGDSQMPALVINPVRTDIDASDNTYDDIVYSIDINVLLNLKSYLNKSPDEQSGYMDLVDFYEEEDSNGAFTANSILKTIRNGMSLDTNTVIENVSSIEYRIRQRDVGEDVVLEGSMHITVKTHKNYG